MAKTKQNWGIALTSILIWIGAGIILAGSFFALVMGGTLASFGLSIGLPDFSAMIVQYALVSMAFGIAYLFLGIFLWYRNKYAWYITLGLLVLALIVTVPSAILAFSPVALIGLALLLAEFFALLNKDAMQATKVKVFGWKGWG